MLAVPLHQAQTAAHEALDDKFDALLDSALFRVGLGLSVFSKDFVVVAYTGVEERVEVSLKKSSQPHLNPDRCALFSPLGVLRAVRSGPSSASTASARSVATWLKTLAQSSMASSGMVL